jgi:hypothetical protein
MAILLAPDGAAFEGKMKAGLHNRCGAKNPAVAVGN